MRLSDMSVEVLVLESVVLERRDRLLNHTQPHHGAWDLFRAPMLALKEEMSDNTGGQTKWQITFGRVLVYSRNMVAFAAVTGKAGIVTWVGSALTTCAWYASHQAAYAFICLS